MIDAKEHPADLAQLLLVLGRRGCEWSLRSMRIRLGLRIPYASHPDRDAAAANDRPRPYLVKG